MKESTNSKAVWHQLGAVLMIIALSTDNGVSPLVGSVLESKGLTGLLGTPIYLMGLAVGLIIAFYSRILSVRDLAIIMPLVVLFSWGTVGAEAAWAVGICRLLFGICAGIILGGFLPLAKSTSDPDTFRRIVALWPFAGGVASLVVPLYVRLPLFSSHVRMLWLVAPAILLLGVGLFTATARQRADTPSRPVVSATSGHKQQKGHWQYFALSPAMFVGVFASLVAASSALVASGATLSTSALPPSFLAAGMIATSIMVSVFHLRLSLVPLMKTVAVCGLGVIACVAVAISTSSVIAVLAALLVLGVVFGFAVMIPGLYVGTITSPGFAKKVSSGLMLGQQAAAAVGAALAVAVGAKAVFGLAVVIALIAVSLLSKKVRT
ncbi:hypothetical protein [Corynebacterium aquilae]|uniref:hypothetical protein n=1 Tax=Corynebacterium aquilae TaxID=203263 RepID=UPI0012EDFDDE|nr:hypothetical protein [Corynebacterium aquilae]